MVWVLSDSFPSFDIRVPDLHQVEVWIPEILVEINVESIGWTSTLPPRVCCCRHQKGSVLQFSFFPFSLSTFHIGIKMKFSALLIASLVGSAYALSSATQPKTAKVSAGGAPNMAGPVDKTMQGIDKDADTFDPTEGDSPAMFRNNNDEVWVKQVRGREICGIDSWKVDDF